MFWSRLLEERASDGAKWFLDIGSLSVRVLDTDLGSCQRTTRGIERGGNERLSTHHRAECAALNLLKGRKKDERKGDSHV